ncbi:MAG: AraC family transcriptional regulator [Planctomycetes bacterium]|nr:AraC family transcriptional regulator [Planctomycetota bacterium]
MSIKHIHENIREKHILGASTRSVVVRADDSDSRNWLAGSPICSDLTDYRISHCGIMVAFPPFEIVRVNLSGTFFFGCIEGEGQVLIDGEWRTVSAGQACVQPPFIPNALKARGRKAWKFCWVRYQGSPNTQPLVSLYAPAIGKFDTSPLQSAIEGLYAEASEAASHHVLRKWTDLVHSYALSFAQPFRGDGRLLKVWQIVENRLNEEWSLERLAQIACISKEHLRRLCSSSLGRTPTQHLTFLRMRYAAELLATTDQKIAQIAQEVGYANQFTFSDAFQRWLGCRPSAYRGRGE